MEGEIQYKRKCKRKIGGKQREKGKRWGRRGKGRREWEGVGGSGRDRERYQEEM